MPRKRRLKNPQFLNDIRELYQVTSSTHGVKSRTNVTTKNGRYYLKQNLLEKDVAVAIIFKVTPDQINMAVLFWYYVKSDVRIA